MKKYIINNKNIIYKIKFLLVVIIIINIFSCTVDDNSNSSGSSGGGSGSDSQSDTIGDISIADKYDSYFTFGFAVSLYQLISVDNILNFHANRLTAENDMKFLPIHPEVNTYDFSNADLIVNFARDNGMKMTGHTFIWHTQCPDWAYSGTEAEVKVKMQSHIKTLIDRYHDVVDNWDVVNEAIGDDNNFRQTGWYNAFGDGEYIKLAFQYAQDALADNSSDAKLYYNDYNLIANGKRTAVLNMIQTWLLNYNIQIDGVGIQAHWNLDWPSINDIQTAIDDIAAMGLKVKISELDISIYTNDDYAASTWEDEKEFTSVLEEEQAQRYKELFELFRQNSDNITSVTLWGVSDDATWLDYFPVTRNNYPLLFNDNHYAKKAYYEIIDF